MLTVKSFTFDQEEEMNEALTHGRLAAGSHVFVSDGKIILPIEDGRPKTKEQHIIDCQEAKNTMLNEMEPVIHSQKVLVRLMKDANIRVDEAKANLAETKKMTGKNRFEAEKECQAALEGATNALNQLEVQHHTNSMELIRLTLNVEIYDERIKELSA